MDYAALKIGAVVSGGLTYREVRVLRGLHLQSRLQVSPPSTEILCPVLIS
jgi:hypothetical protein